MLNWHCDGCGTKVEVSPALKDSDLICFRCQRPLTDNDPEATRQARKDYRRSGPRRGALLAGFVLAVIGIFTYATTSPFGLLLSLEKFWWHRRSMSNRILDGIGVTLGAAGTLFLPFFLVGMWNYSLIGPVPVGLYLIGLMVFIWHRVRIVWMWPA